MGNSEQKYTHATEVRVRYADTDKMQIVYNGKYFEYFEVGRAELLRSLGMSYYELENSGIQLPLIEAQCRYYNPAKYDDLLIVQTSIDLEPSARFKIDYELRVSGQKTIIALGYTIHAFQDTSSGKVIRPPKTFVNLLSKV